MFLLKNNDLRQKTLAFMFDHVGQEYHVRELAALIHADPGNLSRELIKLESEGVFLSHKKGGLKIFSVNKRYPIYKELRAILFKMAGVENLLRDLVMKYNGIVRAFIYGSYAKGKEGKSSDIDLLVVGNIPHERFTEDVRSLEKRLKREINFSSYREEEYEMKKNEKGGFLHAVTAGDIIPLKGALND